MNEETKTPGSNPNVPSRTTPPNRGNEKFTRNTNPPPPPPAPKHKKKG